MMMVGPIDAHIDKTQHITGEYRRQGRQRREFGVVRYLQLQHHDRNDDRQYAVAERFQSVCLHLTDVTDAALHAAIESRRANTKTRLLSSGPWPFFNGGPIIVSVVCS